MAIARNSENFFRDVAIASHPGAGGPDGVPATQIAMLSSQSWAVTLLNQRFEQGVNRDMDEGVLVGAGVYGNGIDHRLNV